MKNIEEKEEFDMAANNKINFQLDFQTGDLKAFQDIKKSIAEVQRLASDLTFTGGMDTTDIQKMISAARTLDTALDQAFDVNLNTVNIQKFNQVLKQSGYDAKTLQADLAHAGSTGQQTFLKMTSQLMQFNTVTKQTNEFLDNIATTLFNTIKQSVMSSIVNNIAGTIQKSYGYVKNLDSALNDIRIVTNKSAEDMEHFAESANNAAKALAVTTEDYTEGSLIYYQQGLDDTTVETLTEITAKTSNVTGQAMKTVSEELTAVWNGYQVANRAATEGMSVYEEYVDKMAAVGASTASNLEELSTAMSKVASAASSMGVGFDDLNAQIATIVSVTRQAPESVGTALKTIYARLGDLKVDGIDEFGTKLGEVSSQLQTMGINILDSNGDMRQMSDVIAEVAQKQNTQTSAQKEAAAVAMAGKRQYNNLVALFDNQDMYGEALRTSMSAAGTLEKQQEVALESLANKMDILKATAEDLYDSLFNVDTITGFVEAGTGVLQFFADFSDAIGGLNNLLPILGSLGLQVFSEQIGRGLSTIVINARNAKEAIDMMITNQQQLQAMFQDSSILNINVENNAALKEYFDELMSYYNEMSQYQGIMSKEQKDQYNNILKMKEAAGSLAVEVEQQKETQIQTHKQIKALEASGEGFELTTDNINKRVEITNKIIEELNDNLQASNLTAENLDSVFESCYKKIGITKEEAQHLTKMLRSEYNTTQDIDKALYNVLQKFQDSNEVLSDITSKEGKIRSLSENSKNLGNALSKGMNTQAAITNVSNLVGALGQLAFSINTLQNIGSIQKNEDLTTGEKLTQTLINLSFVLPGIISSQTKLSEIFKISNRLEEAHLAFFGKKQAARQLEQAQNELSIAQTSKKIALDKLELDYDKQLITNYLEEATAEELKAVGTDKAAAAQLAENIAEKHGVVLGQERTAVLAEMIVAENMETAATEGQTAAQLALNAAMEANPIGAIILGITIAIGAIAGAIKLYQAFTVSAEEAGEALDKSVEKYKELKQQFEESSNELKEVTDRLRELKNIDNPTYVDQKEIAKLEATQALLEAQIESEKELLRLQRKQVVKDATQAANKGTYDVDDPLEDYVDITKTQGQINTVNDYTLNEEDVIDLDTFKASAYKKMQQALEDSGNELLSEEARNNALHAYDYYNSLFTNYQEDIENSQYERTTKLKENYTKSLEFLPDLYEESTFNGVYDDDNVNSEAIQYYEQIALEYYEATGAFQNILQKSANGVFENNKQIQDVVNNLNNEILNAETHTVNEEALGEFLTDEQVQELQLRTQTVGISLYDFLIGLKNYGIKYEEEVDEIVDDTQAKLDEVTKKLSTTTNIIDSLSKGSDLSEDQIKELEKLESEYEELATIQDRQSTAYLNKLLEIREALEKEQIQIKKQLENELIDSAIEIKVYTNGQEENIQNKLREICEADYSVLIDVKSDIQDDFDTTVNAIEAIDNAAAKIGEDFKVAASDIEELNDVFPGILANMDLVGDGTVQLNAEIVKGAMETAEAEVAADTDATIAKIKNQADELAVRRDSARDIANIATSLVDGQRQLTDVEGDLDKALAQLKSDNSDTVATQEQEDQNDVATNAATAATSMANSYGQAYEQMAKDAAKQAEIAHTALLSSTHEDVAPPTDVGGFGGAGFSTTANVDEINSNKTDLSSLEDYSQVDDQQKIADYYNQLADSYDEAYNNALGKIAELLARNSNSRKKFENIGNGYGADGKKDKSGGGKDRQQKDQKEQDDEFDRYWQIKKAIDMVDKAISRLEKDQANLHGQELIDSLKEENKLLEEQSKNYETLLEMQKQEAEELRAQLSTMGLAFDANGAITNYAAATSAALAQYAQAVEQYNAGLIDETTFKVFEKSYENFKKLLERYDALYYTEMQDAQDKLDEMRRKQLANNLKAQEIKIELKLEKTKIKRDQNDFLKDIKQDFTKVQSDLTIDSAYDRDNFKEYMKDVDTTLKAIKDVEKEIDKMKNGEASSMFESISQAQEKLKELQEQLLEQGKSLYELYKALQQNYLDGMDQVKDKYDELMSRYKHLDNELKFQKELIELIYGDKAYDLMNKYYDTQEHNIEAQISSLKTQIESQDNEFNESYKEALKRGVNVDLDDFTTQTEDMKKAYNYMIEAQEDLNDLVLEGVKVLQDKQTNSINQIIDDMNKKMYGMSFDDMKKEQEWAKNLSDLFLDDTQRAYKIQSLANKMAKDISKMSNIKNQQKLQALKEQEIEQLREQKDLTQEDVELAEMRYQIALKEIALEDAQNNKTSMKLTRNEQGNQSYQYVADEDDVADKQEDYMNSMGDYYEKALSYRDRMTEAHQDAIQQRNEELASVEALFKNGKIDYEEYQKELMAIEEKYGDALTSLAERAEVAKREAISVTSQIFGVACEQDATLYETLTEDQKRMVDGQKDTALKDFREVREYLIGEGDESLFPNLYKVAKQVFEDTDEASKTTASKMIGQQATDPDSFKEIVLEAINKMVEATKDYGKKLDDLQKVADKDFSNIANDIDKVDKKINDMNGDTEKLASDSEKYLNELRKMLDEVAKAQKEVSEKILDAKKKMDDYTESVKKAKEAENSGSPSSGSPSGGPSPTPNNPDSGGPGGPSDPGKTETIAKREVSPTADSQYSYKQTSSGSPAKVKTIRVKVGDDPYRDDDKFKAGSPQPFRTGGYTGEQADDSGRLAVLHQKELVLNADDTKNFLAGINTIRDLTALNGSISNSIVNAIAGMVVSLAGIQPSSVQGQAAASSTSNDVYNITAEFPNAYSAEEIKQAILSLPNYASQYVNRNAM